MCGIIGAWFSGRRADALGVVRRATSALEHRGPDSGNVVQVRTRAADDVLVLGHRRLSIIDLSEGGSQPMRDPETGNWIVFNGEVYNFAELRAELEARGCRFRSGSDTEVILQSYRVWGRDCVTRWRGMFAAAIWDSPRQELFLIRDRLGVKPLYYYYDGRQFLFASEVRALLATGLIERRINLAALNTYLMFGAVQDPLTLVEGVMSLPAAHSMTVRADGIELKEYWELPLDGASDGFSAPELYQRIGARLEEAVRLRLISDVPLGVFLSGGVDSGAIAMLARRISPEHIKTFTIGFVDERFSETAQAQRTAASLRVDQRSILLTEDELLTSCDSAIAAFDQPSIDGLNTYYISRAVKEAGIKVAVSGIGGDEAFCGYKHFRSLPWMERFERYRGRVPYVLRQAGASVLGRAGANPKLGALVLDDYGFAQPYLLARSLFLPEQISALLERDILGAVHYGAWGARVRQTLKRAEGLDPVNRISYLEFKTYIANTLLRDADVMSMAHSLEIREPLLDHLLLEDLMRVPGGVKLGHKTPKSLLIKSLPESLPLGVTSAPKRGFTLPFSVWLPGQLRGRVEETFRHPPAALNGIIDPGAARMVWDSFLKGRTSWTGAWALYVLYRVSELLFTPAPRVDSADAAAVLQSTV